MGDTYYNFWLGKSCSFVHFPNEIFYHLGHFNSINENDFNKIYNNHSKIYNNKKHVSSTWGTGWDALLEINENK